MRIERRKNLRLLPEENAFAAIGSRYARVGRIKDIGLGGLAMEYIVGADTKNNSSQVDIFLTGNGFHLYNLPCRLVYDIEIHVPNVNNQYVKILTTKRCGVQFKDLIEEDLAQLKLFIKMHSTGSDQHP